MKIVLVADSVSPSSSGGRVMHKTYHVLRQKGHEVYMLTQGGISEDAGMPVTYMNRSGIIDNTLHQFVKGDSIKACIAFVDAIKPDIVHFGSFNYTTNSFFLRHLHRSGIKTVLQPWIYQFFCAQNFAFRDGKTCDLCAGGNFLYALKYNCGGRIKGIAAACGRYRLHTAALHASVFASTCGYMDSVLRRYGVAEKKIKRLILPFDNSILKKYDGPAVKDDYFIFYGQARDFKGLYLMKELAEKCPGISFKLCPSGVFDHSFFASVPNIDIVTGVSAASGLFELVKKAKGVVMPTIWPTTTEYALYEGLFFGKPVVAFSIGAHIDLLEHNENALVSEPGDTDGMAAHIRLLAADDRLCDRLGINARKLADAIADDDYFFNTLMTIYHN